MTKQQVCRIVFEVSTKGSEATPVTSSFFVFSAASAFRNRGVFRTLPNMYDSNFCKIRDWLSKNFILDV